MKMIRAFFIIFKVVVLLATIAHSEKSDESVNVFRSARGFVQSCLRGQDDLIMPVVKDGRFDVGVGIVPLSITNVDPITHSAKIDFYLTIEYDTDTDHPDVKCIGKNASKVWDMFYNPDIEFTNIANPEFMQGDHWMVEDNKFAFMTRVRGDIQLIGNFINFPFDSIYINIGVAGEDSSHYLIFHPSEWYHEDLKNLLNEFSDVKIPGWTLSKAYFSFNEDIMNENEEYWQEIQLTLEIQRKPLTYVFRLQLPLLCLYLIALFSLNIRNENISRCNFDDLIEARMAVQVGCILALFAYSLYFMTIIPETGYLTLGDLNWSGFMISILLIIVSEYATTKTRFLNLQYSPKFILILISLIIVISLLLYQFIIFIRWMQT